MGKCTGVYTQIIMEDGEAFGGSKVGAAFDPVAFLKKPIVLLRLTALLFSIIVFGCISSQGWQYHQDRAKEVCIMNGSSTACQLGNGVAIVAFLAAIGFLVGEYFFEKMSNVKSRKHYVVTDCIFSGFWSFVYLVSFCTMAHQWSKSEEPPAGYGHGNIGGAIFFSFLSIFVWGGCCLLAWQRYKAGYEAAFAEPNTAFGSGYNSYDQAAPAPSGGGGYQNYHQNTGYTKPPFSEQGADPGYQQVQY